MSSLTDLLKDEDEDFDLEAELDEALDGNDEEAPAVPAAEAPAPTPAHTPPASTPLAAALLSPQPSPALPASVPGPSQLIGEDDLDEDDDEDDDDDEDEDGGDADSPMRPPGADSLPEEMMNRSQADDAAGAGQEESIEEMMKKRQEREAQIVAHFDAIQMERYEHFKRSKLRAASMRKLAEAIVGHKLNDKVIVALCGVTKMHVGEVVESARILANRSGHYGALMPVHIYEAYQVMKNQARLPASKKFSRLFR